MPDLMRLLQIADASFPAGGFAFSSGLESVAKSGYMKTLEDFRQYLECHLEQIASAELPFLNSAFAAAPQSDAFSEVVREWDAWVFLPSPRRASLSQGQGWARAMEAAQAAPAVAEVRPWFARASLPLHFLMAFAATLAAAGFAVGDAQRLLLHLALRDQLGAAVRLGLVGSLQAQNLHRDHIAFGESLRAARADWTHADAVRAAPMIELGQASHPHLYSRLFQS